MKTSLKCHCGQRILRRDVMQQGYYVKQLGPSYVYIKYRCSRCKKLGEHFVKQTERSQFAKLGSITLDEMREFHNALDNLSEIPNLLEKESE